MIIQFITILAALIMTRYVIQKQNTFKENILWGGFSLKIAFSLSVGLVYIFYYDGGDTLSFHQDAYNINTYLKAHPFEVLDVYFNSNSIYGLHNG